MDTILNLDRQLFLFLNQGMNNSFFDWLMPRITDLHKNAYFVTLAGFALVFWIFKKRKQALAYILTLAVSLVLSDMISYRLIKPVVDRSRPADSGLLVTLRTNHHSGKSFPSNHATNIFAASTVLSTAFPAAQVFFVLIAIAVAFSRIYVGVHFPLDVFAGAILGISCAYFSLYLSRKFLRNWFNATKVPENSKPVNEES